MGPRTESYGTPNRRSAGCDRVLPTFTKCVLSDRYDLNQPSVSLLIPQHCVQPVKEIGVVYGIKSHREIQKGEGRDRPFSHIE